MSESIQTFRNTALRRAKEAHDLLSKPLPAPYHGAVVCSLLSAECGLKALILRGYECDDVDKFALLQPALWKRIFKSAKGHDLNILWMYVTSEIQERLYAQVSNGAVVTDTVRALQKEPRYEHRYGATSPKIADAQRIVMQANNLAQWVKKALL